MAESRPPSNFLTVDEGVRPRANSDPTAGTWSKAPTITLPEITVEDCTDNELLEINAGLDEGGLFGMDATPRRRANTCPEDLFRKRNGRPPTPPPSTFRKGSSKFKPGFTKPVLRESVSFIHHRLSKLTEDTGEVHSQSPSPTASGTDRLASGPQQNTIPPSSADGCTSDDLPARIKDDCPSLTDASSPTQCVSSGQSANSPTAQRNNDCLSEPGKAVKGSRAEDASSDSEGNGGTDSHFRAKSSSVDCRYSRMSKPRGLDGTQLQAC